MRTPLELLAGRSLEALVGKPEMDALTEADALQEAQLIEVVFDAVTRRLGLLFDLRQALQLRSANTGLLVFVGVEEFTWAGVPRATKRTAWTVVGSTPDNSKGIVRLRLFFVPDGEAHVTARGAAFYVGDVAGLPPAPPDFLEDSEDVISAGMASMQSSFDTVHATFIEPLTEMDR